MFYKLYFLKRVMELPPLYPVYTNIITLCRDRNYIVPSVLVTPEEYIADYCDVDGNQLFVNRTKLALSFNHRSDRLRNIRVFFHAHHKKTGVGELQHILKQLGDVKTCCIIVLAPGCELTAAAKKMVEGMNAITEDVVSVECFMEQELLVENFLHIGKIHREQYHILSTEERGALEERYKGTAPFWKRFPSIALNDPLARYFGMRRLDVLSTTRASETAGMVTKYMVALHVEELPKEQAIKRAKKE